MNEGTSMDAHPHQHSDLELPKDERTNKVSEAFTQLRKGFKTIQMYQLQVFVQAELESSRAFGMLGQEIGKSLQESLLTVGNYLSGRQAA